MKAYQKLTITDDFMFGKVMENKELCHDILECLMGRPVGQLKDLHQQHTFQDLSDGKPIRLDIYTTDDLALYDAEMQNLNKKTITELCLPKRSRYYQSAIDMDYIKKHASYRSMPEGNVMFICTFDPFGEGLGRYTFQNRCDEKNEYLLNDQTKKYFINCAAKESELKAVSEEFYYLCHYIMTGEPGDELTNRVHEAVESFRRNEKWGEEYMKELFIKQDWYDEGRAEGREEGREEERANTVREKERADHLEQELLELRKRLAGK